MSTSQRVKILRKGLKKSQEAFAEALKVSQGAISLIERGGGASVDLLKEMCNVYGVRLVWLVDGTGAMFENELANENNKQTIISTTTQNQTMSTQTEIEYLKEQNQLLRDKVALMEKLMNAHEDVQNKVKHK